ncbi:MAG: DUF4388 domain-containing protein [Desulfobacterales bacterium]
METKNDSVLSLLAVSSEPHLCSALTAYAKNECSVFPAETVLKALDMLSQAPFDILLADLEDCKRDIVKLFVMAKKKEPGLHLVAAMDADTGMPEGKIMEHSRITFIGKPFTADDFGQKIRAGMRDAERRTHPLSIFDVVLLYSLCRENLMLTVTRQCRTEKNSGTLYFENGGISSAGSGSLLGEDAFYEIMRWTDVRFAERRGETAKFRDITRTREDLLLEVIRHSDRELRMMATQEFRVDEVTPVLSVSDGSEKESGDQNPSEAELTALACRLGISKILKELRDGTDSLENAIVTDTEGMILAELYPESAQPLHRIVMNALDFCYKQSLWPESEGLEEMLLFCQKGIIMLFPVSDKGIMGIAVRHHNFGLIRQICENAAAQIEKILR